MPGTRQTPRKRATTSRARPERGRILNATPSKNTEYDWTFDHAAEAKIVGAPARASGIPASKDLRADWWKINDQGRTGSCVGWATADSVLRWQFVNAKRLAPNQMLSPRFIWMASKETDEFIQRPTSFIEDRKSVV